MKRLWLYCLYENIFRKKVFSRNPWRRTYSSNKKKSRLVFDKKILGLRKRQYNDVIRSHALLIKLMEGPLIRWFVSCPKVYNKLLLKPLIIAVNINLLIGGFMNRNCNPLKDTDTVDAPWLYIGLKPNTGQSMVTMEDVMQMLLPLRYSIVQPVQTPGEMVTCRCNTSPRYCPPTRV